jgi:hypothetical protein
MLMPCLFERATDQLILYLQQNQIGETTSLGVILFNPHGIVEDCEPFIVMMVERLNWGNPIVAVEKVREPRQNYLWEAWHAKSSCAPGNTK